MLYINEAYAQGAPANFKCLSVDLKSKANDFQGFMNALVMSIAAADDLPLGPAVDEDCSAEPVRLALECHHGALLAHDLVVRPTPLVPPSRRLGRVACLGVCSGAVLQALQVLQCEVLQGCQCDHQR